MSYEPNEQTEKKQESVFSKRIKAGKKRTYFFDVRATRGNDYFLTITESIKRFDDNGYERHKVFIYKEDFNKFAKGLTEAMDYVKTDLMPDFDFDAFNHEYPEGTEPYTPNAAQVVANETAQTTAPNEVVIAESTIDPILNNATDPVDKW